MGVGEGQRDAAGTPDAALLRSVCDDLGRLGRDPVRDLVEAAFVAMAQERRLPAGPVEPAVAEVLAGHGVSFAGLRIEELGYLYESLLEAGSRKHAGAHYTPRALAEEVVGHTLDPLVRDRAGDPLGSAEILQLRVVDIACGSGVFLLAAAGYLADRVVEAWSRESEGSALPRSREDAVREVVTRCLYGADINPLAAEIARRSLWLLAGDAAVPPATWDDRVLCGNALLGLVSAEELAVHGVDGPLAADAVVAAVLGCGARPGRELAAATARVDAALVAGDTATLAQIAAAGLAPTVATDYERWQPVHWALAVPEILDRGGFDAVIGNPPFLGVKSIRAALGQNLRDYLARTLLGGESGRSDLVVFFLARAAQLSRRTIGLVLPDAVSEGDSARYGTGAVIAHGFRIYRAETSRPWPSAAGVRIALVWWERGPGGTTTEPAVLDGEPVAAIGPGLGRRASSGPVPRRSPPAWIPHGYQASIVLGRSLVLTPEQATAMIAEDPRAAVWIRDYLSGEDLVTSVGPRGSRRVLDVGHLDEQTWAAVPPVARHLREVVAPERAEQAPRYPHLGDRWWRFHNRVDRLYDEMVGLEEVIGLAKHAKYVWPVLAPVGPIFSNGAVVYPTADRAVYGFLASEPHRLWAVEEGGSRLNQSHRYNPSRLLATYPFPDSIDVVRGPGEQLAAAMGRARDQLGLGVTDLLNRVHGSAPAASEVLAIRAAIAEVDRAVLAAHGFGIELAHGLQTAGSRTWFGLDAATTGLLRRRLLD